MAEIGKTLARRRRANAPGGRAAAHKVKVTAEEEAALLRLANAARITVPRLLVESALRGGAVATEQRDALVELFAIRRLLAGVATNMNQIARRVNAGVQVGGELSGIMDAIRRVVTRIDGAIHDVSR
ncbi:MAG: plasmid mobilization relaxosome protein MobC [Nakamurella sp.]